MSSHVSTAASSVALILLGWAAGSAPALASSATDPGVRAASSTDTFGDPVTGLTADQTTLFFNGQASFKQLEQVTDGLGPRFNLDSCVGCHAFPTHGGSAPAVNPQVALATAFGANNVVPTFLSTNGPIREARFKFTANGVRDGGVHSLFVVSGRVDSSGSAAGCTAVQENFNAQFAKGNVALRIPTPTYGTGLIEQIPDTTLTANLASNASQKAKLGIVDEPSAPSAPAPQSYARSEAPAAPARPRHEFDERQPSSNQSTILIEGGDDFEEADGEEFDEENEPNFNLADGAAPQPVGQAAPAGGGRPGGGPGGNNNRRRRRRGRPGPGGGSGGGRGPASGN